MRRLAEIEVVYAQPQALEADELRSARTRDRQDRRVVWVGLTPEGRKVAEEAINIAIDMSKEFDPALKGPKSSDVVEEN